MNRQVKPKQADHTFTAHRSQGWCYLSISLFLDCTESKVQCSAWLHHLVLSFHKISIQTWSSFISLSELSNTQSAVTDWLTDWLTLKIERIKDQEMYIISLNYHCIVLLYVWNTEQGWAAFKNTSQYFPRYVIVCKKSVISVRVFTLWFFF